MGTRVHVELRSAVWIALIVGASLGFSRAFACAMPFAALAALAGTQLRARDAFMAVLQAWLGNQAIGFLLLHYPQTPTTFAWGGAILLAALLSLSLAVAVRSRAARALEAHALAQLALAFIAAFLGYEALLYVTSFVLSSGQGAFTPAIMARILAINAVAFAALLAVHRGALALGLPASRSPQRLATV